MAPSRAAVLDAVARRLDEEPDAVLPTLRLLADPDAVAGDSDTVTIELARRVNAGRLADRWAAFRAGAYTTGQVRQLLGGITRQAVALRVSNGSLLAAEVGGRLHFPDWQFGPDGVVAGLNRVLGALLEGGRGVLAADALMRGELPEADGRSPADLLAAGNVDAAVHYVTVAGSF